METILCRVDKLKGTERTQLTAEAEGGLFSSPTVPQINGCRIAALGPSSIQFSCGGAVVTVGCELHPVAKGQSMGLA